jgi:tetratricopeptide (TPR) repeat protein
MDLALKLDPSSTDGWFRSGEMLLESNRPEEALGRAQRAIDQNPANPKAWQLHGRASAALSDLDRALADLQHALERSPSDSEILIELAAIYHTRRQPRRALAVLQRLTEAPARGDMPPQALLLEGLSLAELDRFDEAAERFAASISCGHASAEVFYQLARAHQNAGRAVEAQFTLQQALATDPNHTPSRQMLAGLQTATRSGNDPPTR